MKELTTGAVRVIRDSLHVAEQVLTTAAVSPLPRINNREACDAIDELNRTKTPSNVHDANKVIEMIRCAGAIYFTVRRRYVNANSIPSNVYDYKLDEYQAAVRGLGISVGGENQ